MATLSRFWFAALGFASVACGAGSLIGGNGSATGADASSGTGGSTGTGGAPASMLRACDPSGVDAYRGISVGLFRPDSTQDGDLPAQAGGGSEDTNVSGTLAEPTRVDMPACPTCGGQTTAALRVEITDALGGVWALVAAPADNVAAWIPALHEDVGQTVSLSVRFRRIFQSPASVGLVLSDSAGAIVAAEAGPHLNVGINVPGSLSTAPGAPFCARSLSCVGGTPDTEDALVFTSTTSVAVGPAQDGELTIGGRRYLARSLNPVITPGQCPTSQPTSGGEGSDPIEGGTFWMVCREPLANGP